MNDRTDGTGRPTNTDNVIYAEFGKKRRAVPENFGRTSSGRERETPKPDAWIKAGQAITGGRGRNWASQLLIERVEWDTEPARWGRGKTLFKDKKVRDLTFIDSVISAMVQGTQPMPFAVTIQLVSRGENERKAVADAIAKAPAGLFSLTTGRVSGADLPGFLIREKDRLRYSCECPDPSSPCKHVAATILAAAERLDASPQLVLDLRGIHPGEVSAPRERSALAKQNVSDGPAKWQRNRKKQQEAPEPEPTADFWGSELPDIPDVPVAPAILEADRRLLFDALSHVCFTTRDAINLVSEIGEAYQALVETDDDYIDGQLADIIQITPKR